jgi:protocatechuate 3,4-dioxygenase beta subunit
MRTLLTSLVVGAFVASVATWAQTPQVAGVVPASIAGAIVAADGNPIARAVVSIAGPVAFTLVTDDRGRFDFRGCRPASTRSPRPRPASSRWRSVNPIPGAAPDCRSELKDAERRADLRWMLPRAASIAGRVLDHSGQPMRGAIVLLQRRRIVDGESATGVVLRTSDDGQQRAVPAAGRAAG